MSAQKQKLISDAKTAILPKEQVGLAEQDRGAKRA
jgi:hypothetical protein